MEPEAKSLFLPEQRRTHREPASAVVSGVVEARCGHAGPPPERARGRSARVEVGVRAGVSVRKEGWRAEGEAKPSERGHRRWMTASEREREGKE